MPAARVPLSTDEGLQRRLSPRQLTMIAIGGAIGVGLFLGSTVTIGLAGPGVIVTYVIGAVIALIMAYALAEMAVVHPMAGSFGVYAERYLSPWYGFIVRATYGFIQILAIGAEVTAIAIYAAFWFPTVPQWVWVTTVSAVLVVVNTAKVSRFGEFEYLVQPRQGFRHPRLHRRRPGTRRRSRSRRAAGYCQSHERPWRIPPARLDGSVARVDARHHELHGH